MDAFVSKMNSRVEVGGLHCPCCNPWMGKKARLRRTARRKLKADLKAEQTGMEGKENDT